MEHKLEQIKLRVEQMNELTDQYTHLIEKRIENDEDIPITKIYNGIIDYSLKCTKGDYRGKFQYMNLTPQGEIFGSDPENQDLTMYIENCNIDAKHCQITCKNGVYTIKDLGSSTGTWILQNYTDPLPIYSSMAVQIGTDIFSFSFGEIIDDPLEEWLKKYGLIQYVKRIKEAGYKTLELLSKLTIFDMTQLKLTQEENQQLSKAVNDIKLNIIPGHEQAKLVVHDISKNKSYEFGWDGACIGNSETSDIKINFKLLNSPIISNAREAFIKYQYGLYWIVNSKDSPVQEFYKKLNEDDEHDLRPGEIIKIGNIEFQVQRFDIGLSENKGTKTDMEDRHCIFHEINVSDLLDISVFAIFDGHGGTDCVKFVNEKFIVNFRNRLQNSETSFDNQENFYYNIKSILEQSISETDIEFFEKYYNNHYNDCGTTGVILVIIGERIICANIGDSRALISREGKPLLLSKDFKPNRPDEKKRIEEAGGSVLNKRVNGKVATSRTFGNFKFKAISHSNIIAKSDGNGEDIITVKPEIREAQINWLKDEFIVIACDGLFDMMSNQEIIDFQKEKLSNNDLCEQDVQKATEELVDYVKKESIGKTNYCDNLTVCVVALSRGIVPKAEILNAANSSDD